MNQDFKCIVYIFSLSDTGLDKLRFDIVTHVNYAFAIPTKDGHVRPLDNPELAQAVIAKAHAAGAKVFISLGGWSYEDIPLEATFREATDTPEKIAALAEEIVAMAEHYGFDGVDVDWEYPRAGDGTKEQFEQFACVLRQLLRHRGMMLTAAVLAGLDSKYEIIHSAADAIDTPSFDCFDWINLMVYDCDGEKHSTFEWAQNCVNYWVNCRGFSPEKLTLGLPFYGRPESCAYWQLLQADADAPEKDMVIKNGKQVWYNGRETLRKKVALARKRGLGGVMVWEISEDCDDTEKSLLTALGQAIAE